MSYTVTIDSQIFELETSDLTHLDLIAKGNAQYHVLENNQSYQVSVQSFDKATKKMTIIVNGNAYSLTIEDQYDQLVKKMGLSAGKAKKLKNIKAPMPGLILDVLVQPGQAIQEGDPLLILEAMKMENVLKAEGEGIIKSIEVNKSDAVEKGQTIIEME